VAPFPSDITPYVPPPIVLLPCPARGLRFSPAVRSLPTTNLLLCAWSEGDQMSTERHDAWVEVVIMDELVHACA